MVYFDEMHLKKNEVVQIDWELECFLKKIFFVFKIQSFSNTVVRVIFLCGIITNTARFDLIDGYVYVRKVGVF